MIITFVTVLAWILGIGSALLVYLRLHSMLTYSPLERSVDRLSGVKATWPVGVPLTIFVISLSWIISTFINTP